MDFPQRKPTRLKGYDYSTPGAYFVTICTYGRKQILSKITVGEGLRALPRNTLTPIGIEIKKSIKYIDENIGGVKIDKYVIMPNHIHMIIVILEAERINPFPTKNMIFQVWLENLNPE